METEIRAGAVLDVLTADELKTVLEELASGYLRNPYRVRIEAGATTNGSGDVLIDNVAQARPGFQLLVNRLEVTPDGYTFASPFAPVSQGAVTVLRAPAEGSSLGDVKDGYPFGASTGGSLPCVYSAGDDRAVDLVDQEVCQVQVTGGPTSTPVVVRGHGTMIPLPDQAAY